jgi:FkbM family methyltransferase
MTVLDIGANIGFYSILFSQLVGKNGRVIAFEPDENNFKHLKQLTDRLKNVTAIRAAVGERNEKIKLYYSNDLNIDHQTYDNGQNRSYKEIDGIFIDGYFKNNETVDFVKIDIQGYDYYAIKGMRQTIERSKGVVILGEFWPYGLKSAGIRASEYIELLESLDLTVNFSQKSITKENVDSFASNWFYYTDFIATK